MARAGQATITRPITHALAKAGGVSGTGHALKTAAQAHRNTAPVAHARQTHKQAPPGLPAWTQDSSGRWHQNTRGVSWAEFAGLGPQTGLASGKGSGGTGFYSSPAPSARAITAGSWNSGTGSGGSGFGGGQPAPHFAIGGGGAGFGSSGGVGGVGGSGAGSGAPDGTGAGATFDPSQPGNPGEYTAPGYDSSGFGWHSETGLGIGIANPAFNINFSGAGNGGGPSLGSTANVGGNPVTNPSGQGGSFGGGPGGYGTPDTTGDGGSPSGSNY